VSGLVDVVRQMAVPVPQPVRVAALIVVAVLLICQAGPFVIGVVGRMVAAAAQPLVALLAAPEYLATSWLRDHHRRPLPGSFGYDRALEIAATVIIAVTTAADRHLGKRRRVPWLATFMVAAVPIVAFYGSAALATTKQTQQVTAAVDGTQSAWLSVDGWLMTGDLTPCTQPGVMPLGLLTKPLPACTSRPRPAAPAKGQRRAGGALSGRSV
jgi:ABC-type transport system involved in cytochrome c biogenesis permease subunit